MQSFPGVLQPADAQLYLEQKKPVRQYLALLGFFPIFNKTISNNDQCRFSVTSGIGPDILIKVLEDCIYIPYLGSLDFD